MLLDIIIQVLIANGGAKLACIGCGQGFTSSGQMEVKIALILQAALFIVFIGVLGIWHARAHKANALKPKVAIVSGTLYASSVLIIVRCIYRAVEYFVGFSIHEVYFFVFDAGLMLINVAIFNIWHPGRLFPSNGRVYLGRDGSTELQGPG